VSTDIIILGSRGDIWSTQKWRISSTTLFQAYTKKFCHSTSTVTVSVVTSRQMTIACWSHSASSFVYSAMVLWHIMLWRQLIDSNTSLLLLKVPCLLTVTNLCHHGLLWDSCKIFNWEE